MVWFLSSKLPDTKHRHPISTATTTSGNNSAANKRSTDFAQVQRSRQQQQPLQHRFEYTDWTRDNSTYNASSSTPGDSSCAAFGKNSSFRNGPSVSFDDVECLRLNSRNKFKRRGFSTKIKTSKSHSSASFGRFQSARISSSSRDGGVSLGSESGDLLGRKMTVKNKDKGSKGLKGSDGASNPVRHNQYGIDTDSDAFMPNSGEGFYYGSPTAGFSSEADNEKRSQYFAYNTRHSQAAVGSSTGGGGHSDTSYHQHHQSHHLNTSGVGSNDTEEMQYDACGDKVQVTTIPGLPQVLSKSTHWARRIAWGIVLSVCFGITLAQCYERIVHYLGMPVNVDVQIQRNSSLKFPVVTICNKNAFNVTRMKLLLTTPDENGLTGEKLLNKPFTAAGFGELIGFRNLTAEGIWDSTAHDRTVMMTECWFGRGLRCHERGTWKIIFTIIGVCYTYELNGTTSTSGMFNNMYLKFKETLPLANRSNSEFGWKIHLHDARDSPVLDVQSHGFTILPGWNKDVRLGLRDFKTLNTKQRPCDSRDEYSTTLCVADCFARVLLRRAGCLLPYISPFLPEAPTCDSRQSYEKASKEADAMFNWGEWNPNDCQCRRECDHSYYTPYGETMTNSDNTSARLRIFYQEMTYDDINEDLAYTEIPLLCDIGGALGLMLGASVLTFVEVLESFWHMMARLGSRSASRKTSQQHKLYRGS